MLKTFLLILQMILGGALVFLILIQAKGVGLGAPFGGALWGGYSTKRGVEKAIFYLTIALAVLFFLTSLAQIILG
jgi:preprotein translocase subunit SecG